MNKQPKIQQVAAAIMEKNGTFFIAQRAKKDNLYGKWEFPGGKVEEGETLEECLKRELNEELGITVTVGKQVCATVFISEQGRQMEMVAFKVPSFSGNITLKEHQTFAWIQAKDLVSYDFPTPDNPIIDRLLEEQILSKQEKMLLKTVLFAKQTFQGKESGHDWWHTYRVWTTAKQLAVYEQANLFIVELAALLHDIADWKFTEGNDDTVGATIADQWLTKMGVEESTCKHITSIIQDLSFKGAGVTTSMKTIEGKIVQDADRLDAIGAIGIARAFSYGGFKQRELYNPSITPQHHQTFQDYKTSIGTTINHFYEKLLLLKDLMNTVEAQKIAQKRHAFMEEYLKTFLQEWAGKD